MDGAGRPIESDALGFLVIHPECAGACAVDLIFDGGAEMKIARAIQLLSVAICIILCLSLVKWTQWQIRPRSD